MGVAATLFGAQHLKGIEQRRPGAAQWLPGPRSIGQKEFPKKIFHFGFSISDNKSLLLLLLLLLYRFPCLSQYHRGLCLDHSCSPYTSYLFETSYPSMVYAIIYADDIQIYASCPSTQDAAVDSLMVRLEACLSDIKDWMRKHFLKLNDSKSEFALIGSLQQRRKVVIPNLMVGDTVIAPVDQVRSLGLLLDATMTMEPQIGNCIKSSVYHLRNIHKVKRYLNPQALKSLIHAFITSRLDIIGLTSMPGPYSTENPKCCCADDFWHLSFRTYFSSFYWSSRATSKEEEGGL